MLSLRNILSLQNWLVKTTFCTGPQISRTTAVNVSTTGHGWVGFGLSPNGHADARLGCNNSLGQQWRRSSTQGEVQFSTPVLYHGADSLSI